MCVPVRPLWYYALHLVRIPRTGSLVERFPRWDGAWIRMFAMRDHEDVSPPHPNPPAVPPPLFTAHALSSE